MDKRIKELLKAIKDDKVKSVTIESLDSQI
jgi:hypothetical protein